MARVSALSVVSLALALVVLALMAVSLYAAGNPGQGSAPSVVPPQPASASTPTAVLLLPLPPAPLPTETPAVTPIVPLAATPTAHPTLGSTASAKPVSGARAQPTVAPTVGVQSAGMAPDAWLAPRAVGAVLPDRVQIVDAVPAPGERYWRLVAVDWLPPEESGGRHHIYVELLDETGERAVGQTVEIQWPGGLARIQAEGNKPEGEAVAFPQYGLLGSYAVQVQGLPSDKILGLGLGLLEDPVWAEHTCWYLVFQVSRK